MSTLTARHPSRRATAPLIFWRRALALIACAVLGAASLPGHVSAQETDDVAAARQALTAARDTAASELAAVESELSATVARLAEVEAEIATRRDERAAATSRREQARLEREEPLAVRRAIALEIYMAGDPHSMSLIREILEANASMDGARDRALYRSVVDWASDTLDRLDREIDTLTAEIGDLEERIGDLEADRADLEAGQAEQIRRRDELAAELADLERQLATLNTAPLTGLPVDRVVDRPTLIVKIDNASRARPQTGLNQADIVVEEKVEAGLTRFAALFQSTGAEPVGPVRSARTSDVQLFANLGSPLFAFSGANRGVGGAVAGSNLVDVSYPRRRGLYERVSSRRAPHNLFSSTTALWRAAAAGPPVRIFEYREDGAPLPSDARPSAGVDLHYGSTRAGFSWNGSGWVRSTDGRPHPDASGAAVAPANVVVRFTDYVPSTADARSPEAVVTGSGELWVLTAGHVVVGRWEQPSLTAPTRWLDASGEPIALTPGRTWIVMPEPGRATLR